jgi:hypothetical protein
VTAPPSAIVFGESFVRTQPTDDAQRPLAVAELLEGFGPGRLH